jgi:RimJ/RimL family protein N-acetyltransferase
VTDAATDVVFETERLVVRRWSLDDAAAAFQIYGDPAVMHFLGDGTPMRDVAAQRDRLAQKIRAYEERPGLGGWAMQRRGDGAVIGSVLLQRLPGDERVEVGWHLARAAWGAGYATEAARGALGHGFAGLRLQEIFAVVDARNSRSLSVVQRLGMTPLGSTDRYYGHRLELFVASRLDDGQRG